MLQQSAKMGQNSKMMVQWGWKKCTPFIPYGSSVDEKAQVSWNVRLQTALNATYLRFGEKLLNNNTLHSTSIVYINRVRTRWIPYPTRTNSLSTDSAGKARSHSLTSLTLTPKRNKKLTLRTPLFFFVNSNLNF